MESPRPHQSILKLGVDLLLPHLLVLRLLELGHTQGPEEAPNGLVVPEALVVSPPAVAVTSRRSTPLSAVSGSPFGRQPSLVLAPENMSTREIPVVLAPEHLLGADVKNGLWAIYGTLLGCQMTNLTDWDFVNVRDFEYLNNLWEQLSVTEETIDDEIEVLGDKLIEELNIPIAVTPLDAGQSSFFKTIYQTPSRKPSQQFVIDPE